VNSWRTVFRAVLGRDRDAESCRHFLLAQSLLKTDHRDGVVVHELLKKAFKIDGYTVGHASTSEGVHLDEHDDPLNAAAASAPCGGGAALMKHSR